MLMVVDTGATSTIIRPHLPTSAWQLNVFVTIGSINRKQRVLEADIEDKAILGMNVINNNAIN